MPWSDKSSGPPLIKAQYLPPSLTCPYSIVQGQNEGHQPTLRATFMSPWLNSVEYFAWELEAWTRGSKGIFQVSLSCFSPRQIYSVGIVTARDALALGWTPEEVWNTVRAFSNMDSELAREAFKLDKDGRDWKVELAQ